MENGNFVSIANITSDCGLNVVEELAVSALRNYHCMLECKVGLSEGSCKCYK
jgi:hypothetical protein